MSDYARMMEYRRTSQAFEAAVAGCVLSMNVSITNGSTAATLASTNAALLNGAVYNISATGIPASTTFAYNGTTAIVLSNAATATNATAAATITF